MSFILFYYILYKEIFSQMINNNLVTNYLHQKYQKNRLASIVIVWIYLFTSLFSVCSDYGNNNIINFVH